MLLKLFWIAEWRLFFNFCQDLQYNCKDFTNLNSLMLLHCSFSRSKLEYDSIVLYRLYVDTYIHTLCTLNLKECIESFEQIMYATISEYPDIGCYYNIIFCRFSVIVILNVSRFLVIFAYNSIAFYFGVLHVESRQ